MSPTDANVMRYSLMSGSGGGAGGAGGAAGSGSVTATGSAGSTGGGSGVVAQPASIASSRAATGSLVLVTKPDAQYVDLGRAQAAAQHVEFIEIIRRANTYPVISLVVDRNALN